jgi:anti-sigma factor RsiW
MTAPTHLDAAAYALHALPPPEHTAFENHLAECGMCAAELLEFLETAALLGAAAADEPPSKLRERVLHDASVTPQLPPHTAHNDTAHEGTADNGTADNGTAVDGQRGDSDREPPADADRGDRRSGGRHAAGAAEIGEARRRRRWLQRPVTWVAAAVIALLIAGGAVVATLPSGQSPQEAAVSCVSQAPDAQQHRPNVGKGGSVTVAWSCDAAVVHPASLPGLPSGKAYQFWVIAGKKARSPGMVAQLSGPSGRIVVTDLQRSDTNVGISVEPSAGSEAPTTTPLWVAPLQS